MKQCPYCNAQMTDESKFCGECGKEYPQGKTCPHCGAKVYDVDVYCENCGRKLIDEGNASIDTVSDEIREGGESPYKKKYLFYVLFAIALIAFIGGGWYVYKEYSAYTEKKLARNKFVADSLEQVKRDSIKLVKLKEQARKDSIEKARILSLQKPYLSLLDKHNVEDNNWGKLYFLFDITGDDFPELWLQVSEEDEYNLLVYSNIDGEAKLLFRKNVGHPYHHSFHNGGNYILMNFCHMGSQVIYKYYLEKGLIKEQHIFTLEAASFDEVEYKDVSEPEVPTFEITDKAPIYEIK